MWPWWAEERRRSAGFDVMASCEKCMATNDLQTRQMLGCGWAPIPPERLRRFVEAPTPLQFKPLLTDDGDRLVNVCPGYLVALPQAIEIARGLRHWEKGHLVEYCRGEPSQAMIDGVEILSGANTALANAVARPADQGGIGAG